MPSLQDPVGNEEQMTINERRKYLRLIKRRYVEAGKLERGRLLDEMEVVTGLHRKSLIRLISSDLKRKPRCKHRGRKYGSEVDDALRVISESFDHICAERLSHRDTLRTTQPGMDGYSPGSPRQIGNLTPSVGSVEPDQRLNHETDPQAYPARRAPSPFPRDPVRTQKTFQGQ